MLTFMRGSPLRSPISALCKSTEVYASLLIVRMSHLVIPPGITSANNIKPKLTKRSYEIYQLNQCVPPIKNRV